MRLGAKKAVIFATGGFIHDKDMRKAYLNVPVLGSCAAMTNEGDFVHIGPRLARSSQHELFLDVPRWSWRRSLRKDPDLIGTFSPSGDSMIYVDRNGKRVTNEKLAYNEVGAGFLQMGPGAIGISESRPDRDLGPAQPG